MYKLHFMVVFRAGRFTIESFAFYMCVFTQGTKSEICRSDNSLTALPPGVGVGNQITSRQCVDSAVQCAEWSSTCDQRALVGNIGEVLIGPKSATEMMTQTLISDGR